MTISIQEKYQTKIDMLESLQAWFDAQTQPVQMYGSGDIHQHQSFEEILVELSTKELTIDILFDVSSLSKAIITNEIYENLGLKTPNIEYPLMQIFEHINQNKSSMDEDTVGLVNQLFESQINGYRKTLTMLKKSMPSKVHAIELSKEEVKTSYKKPSSNSCFKRYFCCCFNFYKSDKYQGIKSTEGENTSLLQQARKQSR